ncbi:MAG: HD domain-containing protein [Sphaerochaetaceae bacterium]
MHDTGVIGIIMDIPGLFYRAYQYEHLGIAEGKAWVETALEQQRKQLSKHSQAFFQDTYSMAKQLFLGNSGGSYAYETSIERALAALVEKACLAEQNVYGYGIWENHIAPMVTIAQELSFVHGADSEVVRIATLLHDLAGIEDFSKAKEHHIHGATRARQILGEAGYSADKTELVAQCILHHRGSLLLPKESAEERCLADADAVAHMSDLPSLFFVAYNRQGLDFEEGRQWVMQKIKRDWQKMSEIAREKYGNQYDAIIRLLC